MNNFCLGNFLDLIPWCYVSQLIRYMHNAAFIPGEEGEGHFHIGLFGEVLTTRISIVSKNSRTWFKISVKIPEQVSLKPLIL